MHFSLCRVKFQILEKIPGVQNQIIVLKFQINWIREVLARFQVTQLESFRWPSKPLDG